MARLTGLSQPFLSMLEAGVRKLTNIDKIVRLLDGLEAPMELTGPMLRASEESTSPCGGSDRSSSGSGTR
ncbi:helix-turn-helix domain-containing protein [Streptomyces caatingaensis]|uniref:helix-turn-helix domain-containing protein n=1 Tax=Streptomyces caatingaensis TaxID=1678637 RepID=UPI000AA0DE42